MLIASGIEIMWPSTNASIPAGWTRVTNMDSKYPKGTAAAVNPDVTGGATTHLHTDPGHTHTESAHTHDTSSPTVTTANEIRADGTPDLSAGASSHTHTISSLTSSSDTPTSGSTAGVWGSTSSDPAYYDVIWISSNGTPTGFPANSWTFWDKGASLPTSWSNPAAARNVFPKGAVAAGDGGGTGGGSHTHTASAHTHTFNSHSHTGGTTGATSPANRASPSTEAPVSYGTASHTHVWAMNTGSTSSGSASSAATGSQTYEPEFAKLAIVQNDSGVTNIQVRHVAVWAGTLSAIPTNWVLCDGTNSTVDMRGKFVKGANGVGEIGNTGGTAGHSHTSPAAHTHAYDHTHLAGTGGPTPSYNYDGDAGGSGGTAGGHGHNPGNTSTTATGTSGSTAQTAPSTADTQPAFRTRAFIALITLPAAIQQALIIN